METTATTRTCGRCGGEFEPASNRVKNCGDCTRMLQAAVKADIYRPVADALAAAVAEGITGERWVAGAVAEAASQCSGHEEPPFDAEAATREILAQLRLQGGAGRA